MSGTKRRPVHLVSHLTNGKPYCGQKGKRVVRTNNPDLVTCTACMRALNYFVKQRERELEAQKEYEEMMARFEKEFLERQAERKGESKVEDQADS